MNYRTIGNVADADLDSYAETLVNVRKKYKDVVIVVPGHGKPGDHSIIDHTSELLAKYLDKIDN